MNGKIGPALTSSSYGGHKEIVLFLLEAGADINVRDQNGLTSLMSAVVAEKPEIVIILLENGANISLPRLPITRDKEGNVANALALARMKQNKEIIEILINWESNNQKYLSPFLNPNFR